jgi:hypothetical protein
VDAITLVPDTNWTKLCLATMEEMQRVVRSYLLIQLCGRWQFIVNNYESQEAFDLVQ